LYCYATDFESAPPGRIEYKSAELASQALQDNAAFVPAIYGTAISMGCYADPLHPTCVSTTEEILAQVMVFGNPVQMASKCFSGSARMAPRIAAKQQYAGQFTLLVSLTSFSHAVEIEPGAPTPLERLGVLAEFQQAGINTALFIKPMIPGVTEYELDAFAEAIRKFEISNCVVFLCNRRILDRFKGKDCT
jgi:DNA repair photolyase